MGGGGVNNTTKMILVQTCLEVRQMTTVPCDCCLALHEAPFIEKLVKPSVFRHDALLASELFKLSFGRYTNSTKSPFTRNLVFANLSYSAQNGCLECLVV